MTDKQYVDLQATLWSLITAVVAIAAKLEATVWWAPWLFFCVVLVWLGISPKTKKL